MGIDNNIVSSAKELFYIMNTKHSEDGNEILDEDELKQARACGLYQNLFDFGDNTTVTEQQFINKYAEVAQKSNEDKFRQEEFKCYCDNIKQCYNDLEKYGKLHFGLDNYSDNKELEVSMNTIERVPREGMYTMLHGYKIAYKNGVYVCPEKEEWGSDKNIYGLTFFIKQELTEQVSDNFNKQIKEAKTKDEKEQIVKELVENIKKIRSDMTPEFFEVNDIRGNRTLRFNGLNIYYTVGENYSISFDIERILEQIP